MFVILSSLLIVGYLLIMNKFVELDFKIREQEIFEYRYKKYKCTFLGDVDDKSFK